MNILIQTHNCSREEAAELLAYLEDQSWSHQKLDNDCTVQLVANQRPVITNHFASKPPAV